MNNRLLSADELCDSFKDRQLFSLPSKGGIKSNQVDKSHLDDANLQIFLEQRENVLKQERVQKLSKLATAIWLPEIKRVQVTKIVGKFWNHVGYRHSGKDLLYPEEAIYLVEQGSMIIYAKGLPMSLEEAYCTLLNSKHSVSKYQVYAHLSRYGYIVLPFERCSTSSNNKRKMVDETNNSISKKLKNSDDSLDLFDKAIHHGDDINIKSKQLQTGGISNSKLAQDLKVQNHADICASKSISGTLVKDEFNKIFSSDTIEEKTNLVNSSEYITDYSLEENTLSDLKNYDLSKLANSYLADTSDQENSRLLISNLEEVNSMIDLACIFVIIHKSSKRKISFNKPDDCTLLPPGSEFPKDAYSIEFAFNTKDEYLEIPISVRDLINSSYSPLKTKDLFESVSCGLSLDMLANTTSYTISDYEDIVKLLFSNLRGKDVFSAKSSDLPDFCVDNKTEGENIITKFTLNSQSKLEADNISNKATNTDLNATAETRDYKSTCENHSTTLVLTRPQCLSLCGHDVVGLGICGEGLLPLNCSELLKKENVPLVDIFKINSDDDIFSKLNIIKNVDEDTNTDLIFSQSSKIDYSVFLPGNNFKKSKPGEPSFCLHIQGCDEQPPKYTDLRQMFLLSRPTPLIIASTNHGECFFYSFDALPIPMCSYIN